MGDPRRRSIPVLALWLEGLGVNVIFNRPRRPTDNAKVERMQRTTKNWAEVNQCIDIHQLEERLKITCEIQRELYKVTRLTNKPRKDVFPELYTNPRKYQSESFNVNRIYQRLASWTFVRQSSSSGQVSIYNQIYYLGIIYKKQYIAIKFNEQTLEWQFYDAKGLLIKVMKAKKMDKSNLWNLTVCQRTNS